MPDQTKRSAVTSGTGARGQAPHVLSALNATAQPKQNPLQGEGRLAPHVQKSVAACVQRKAAVGPTVHATRRHPVAGCSPGVAQPAFFLKKTVFTGVRGGLNGDVIKGSLKITNPAAEGVWFSIDKKIAEGYAGRGGDVVKVDLNELRSHYFVEDIFGMDFKVHGDVDLIRLPTAVKTTLE